jgi:peptidyl-prolyl cis-trans isomerase SDCCAG10
VLTIVLFCCVSVHRNFQLLSFGDEAEDEEEEINQVNVKFSGKSKSSHDLISDPKLSKQPALVLEPSSSSTKPPPPAAAGKGSDEEEELAEEKSDKKESSEATE